MIPFADILLRSARKRNVSLFVVGGFLRDHFMNRKSHDLDLVANVDPRTIGMDLADSTGGQYFELNLDHSTARVTLNWGENFWQVDIGSIRGRDIHEDLHNRDFTVNAMALPLEKLASGLSWQDYLLDPFNGRKDLEKGLLRIIGEDVIVDDPLRMIRGIRFASTLQFDLEKQTAYLFKKNRALLFRVSALRLKMEMGKILKNPAVKYFWLMQRLQFTQTLFPSLEKFLQTSEAKIPYRGWEQSMLTLHYLEKLIKEMPFSQQWKHHLESYLKEELSTGWSRIKILKLAALFHNIKISESGSSLEKEGADYYLPSKVWGYLFRYGRRMHLNRAENNLIKKVVSYYMVPLKRYMFPDRNPRTLYRFYRNLGNEAPGILLFSLADFMALVDYPNPADVERPLLPSLEDYGAFINRLLYRYFISKESLVPIPSMITKQELVTYLGINPGRLSTAIFEAIAEAQAEGKITTRKEAFKYAEKEYRRRMAGGQ